MSTILTGCGGSSSNSGGTTTTATPTVSSISPTTVAAGSGDLTLTVNGTGFLSTTTVQVGTVAEPTTYVSSTQVTAAVPAKQIAAGGQFSVIALNGTASSGSGAAVNLQVTNPAPTISQLNPASLLANSSSLVVTVTGTGFVPSTTIAVNGSARASTYVSATQIDVALAATDVASAGTLSLTAVNTTPGGGTSAASALTVNNPPPGTGTLSTHVVLSNATVPATITVTGTNYVTTSTVLINGTARTTTYVNSSQLTFQLTAADLATAQSLSVTIQNPAPIGGSASAGTLYVLQSTATPVLTQVSPSQIVAGSGSTTITIYGSNLLQQLSSGSYYLTSTVLWNGTALTSTSYSTYYSTPYLVATVPASLLTTTGTASVTVSSIAATPAVSNALTVSITNPPAPTLTSISPSAGPLSTAAAVTLTGTGFTSASTVAVNGTSVASTYVSSTQITATLPASSLTLPGNANITVTTPAPGGGTSSPLPFTVYIGIPNNSMVYNPINGLLYVSVPSSAGTQYGNTVVPIDPATGILGTPIPVGSEPDKMAITPDGQYLWVALDGASAVRQVNLTTGTAGMKFSIPGGSGYYSTPPTINALAAVPGADNSVVVATSGSTLSTTVAPLGIYNSGILRGAGVSFNATALQINGTTNEIYAAAGSTYNVYTYSSGGLTLKGTAANGTYANSYNDDLLVAGGRTYTDYGSVYDADAGALLGNFYVTGTTVAQGPATADTTLGSAYILDNPQGYSNLSSNAQIQVFSLAHYASTAVIPVNLASSTNSNNGPSRLTRWGANGLAFRSSTAVYTLRSNLVEDLSTVSADLGVTLAQSGGSTTGTNTTYTATVTNSGPSSSTGVAFTAQTPATGQLVSVTPSTGGCTVSAAITCNLGGLASGASATVAMVVTQTTAGNNAAAVQVSGPENDPTSSNNSASVTLAVTGSTYNLTPTITAISPSVIQTGASDTTITVTGTGFSSASTVLLGSTALATTYTSSSLLSATVPSANLASLGWASITVSNPAPGGGVSSPQPLTVYQVLTVGVNHILYEPYSRKIYASVAAGSTSVAANSIAAITPETGTVGTPITVTGLPSKLAISDDGNVLYTLFTGSYGISMFNLQTQSQIFTFNPLSTNPCCNTTTGYRDIAVVPGTENSVVIDFGSYSGLGIVDVNPTTETVAIRGTVASYYKGSGLQFYDPQTLYLDNIDNSSSIDKYGITASGFSNGNAALSSSYLNHFGLFQLRGNLAFARAGGLADVTTTPATELGYYTPLATYGAAQQVAPDASLGEVFFLSNTSSSTSYYSSPDGIVAYKQASFGLQGTLPLNMSATEGTTSFTGVDLIRWGQDGLAALTSSGHIYLLRGAFVVPQLLTKNAAASLASSSSSSITHGAGNTLLTLTGSNFLPGVAVTWNGSYRTTTIVDATHVTVAIPASDLASAGSGSLVATNPGASASSALTVTIN
ncbi:MAG: IPT/TIG domain-containing protein [Terracidiphilus sp.]|nr:IPT/TIG domain-containing protein [Terracidiphilus sp.]